MRAWYGHVARVDHGIPDFCHQCRALPRISKYRPDPFCLRECGEPVRHRAEGANHVAARRAAPNHPSPGGRFGRIELEARIGGTKKWPPMRKFPGAVCPVSS